MTRWSLKFPADPSEEKVMTMGTANDRLEGGLTEGALELVEGFSPEEMALLHECRASIEKDDALQETLDEADEPVTDQLQEPRPAPGDCTPEEYWRRRS